MTPAAGPDVAAGCGSHLPGPRIPLTGDRAAGQIRDQAPERDEAGSRTAWACRGQAASGRLAGVTAPE
jgi:hypothetical protein